MPTISVSNSLHFPANFLEKTETHIRRMNIFSLKQNRTVPSFLSLQEKKRSVSVSTNCTFGRNQDFKVDLKNRNGWFHFVGIGGCGLSALAMVLRLVAWSSNMHGLKDAGARLYIGHSMSNIEGNNGGSRFPDALLFQVPFHIIMLRFYMPNLLEYLYRRDYWLARLTLNYNLLLLVVVMIAICSPDRGLLHFPTITLPTSPPPFPALATPPPSSSG
ncbi:hypothetical protein Dsin_014286 [Dipteronia sinensis]|uniref:Uncharacterized protein n=1 Tax=Dipteronia sinensis TaxID=43782 RepID=A0AAE0ALH0_9ROSI|nr:hypothetical protein Dsin_014286 [Dipteronia sinensis]